jgi:hypothetical protein
MMRTSTLSQRVPPSRRTSDFWIARRSRDWSEVSRSPISSMSSVPPSASSKTPGRAFVAPSEGPFLEAEERGLDQRRGRCRAVEDDERPVRTPARGVDRLGEHFLAGARLALDDERDR